jgi:hypothetical protein
MPPSHGQEIGSDYDHLDSRHRGSACPTIAPAMKTSAALGGAHESQALRPVSLYAARFGGSLRSPSLTLRVREVRPRASNA